MQGFYDYNKLLNRFNELLSKDSFTDAEVSKKVGITPATLSKYKNGLRRMNLESVANIARLYGISTDYLLGLTDASPSNLSTREACEATGLTEKALEGLRHLTQIKTSFNDAEEHLAFKEDEFSINLPPISNNDNPISVQQVEPSRRTVINELIASKEFVELVDTLRDCIAMKITASIHEQLYDISPYRGSETDRYEDNRNRSSITLNTHDAISAVLNNLTEAYLTQHKMELEKALQDYTLQSQLTEDLCKF